MNAPENVSDGCDYVANAAGYWSVTNYRASEEGIYSEIVDPRVAERQERKPVDVRFRLRHIGINGRCEGKRSFVGSIYSGDERRGVVEQDLTQ